MMVFAFAGFIVQAGVSLHQVPHFVDQGVPPSVAVWTASTFAISQVPASVVFSAMAQKTQARFVMTVSGLVVATGAITTAYASEIAVGVLGAFFLGFGVGGLHIMARLAGADYFGRLHLGAIRAWGLAAQVGGQALGPTAAGLAVDPLRQLPGSIPRLRHQPGSSLAAHANGNPARAGTRRGMGRLSEQTDKPGEEGLSQIGVNVQIAVPNS